MEGGLDDCNLLQFASPKEKNENENGGIGRDFAKPRIPSPKKNRYNNEGIFLFLDRWRLIYF